MNSYTKENLERNPSSSKLSVDKYESGVASPQDFCEGSATEMTGRIRGFSRSLSVRTEAV